MAQNIVVVTGSPRVHGNSDALAEEFIAGAESSGNKVIRFDAGRMYIRGCNDCRYCFSNNGECVIRDDMQEIYPALYEADILVLSSPIYWYGLTAQIKAMIDRMFASSARPYPIKALGLLAVFGDSNSKVFEATELHYRTICEFLGWEKLFIVSQKAVIEKGDIKGKKSLIEARRRGEEITG
jgi:multimeric flavodoxin WrbA